jgi:hypothetical protein
MRARSLAEQWLEARLGCRIVLVPLSAAGRERFFS